MVKTSIWREKWGLFLVRGDWFCDWLYYRTLRITPQSLIVFHINGGLLVCRTWLDHRIYIRQSKYGQNVKMLMLMLTIFQKSAEKAKKLFAFFSGQFFLQNFNSWFMPWNQFLMLRNNIMSMGNTSLQMRNNLILMKNDFIFNFNCGH